MPLARMPQNIATIILPDQTHVLIKRAFSRWIKGVGIQNVFETESAYIYGSGKPVTDKKDLEWLSEPDRSKALQWYDTGKKGQEKLQLDEIGELKRQLAELQGKLMGMESIKGKEPEGVKVEVVEEKKENVKKVDKGKGRVVSAEVKKIQSDRMKKYWADIKAAQTSPA